MIGRKTKLGRQAIDKPLARRLARYVAYLQKELDAIDHGIIGDGHQTFPELGAEPRRSRKIRFPVPRRDRTNFPR